MWEQGRQVDMAHAVTANLAKRYFRTAFSQVIPLYFALILTTQAP